MEMGKKGRSEGSTGIGYALLRSLSSKRVRVC
jgi:hypothetical protein